MQKSENLKMEFHFEQNIRTFTPCSTYPFVTLLFLVMGNRYYLLKGVRVQVVGC